MFERGSRMASVTIPTFNDTILEGLESFEAVLNLPSAASDLGVVVGSAGKAAVDITDATGGHLLLPSTASALQHSLTPSLSPPSTPSLTPSCVCVLQPDHVHCEGGADCQHHLDSRQGVCC